jgi:hypothetical protein
MADPVRPTAPGFLALGHDPTKMLPARAEDVTVANDTAYLAAGTAGLWVVDLSSPSEPQQWGTTDTPGRADNLATDGEHVFLIDGDLRIFDVSNPAAPAETGFFDLVDGPDGSYLAVQGPYAFVSGDGLKVLDVSDIREPAVVAEHPLPRGSVAVAGETVCVAGDGLFVLRAQ